MPAANWPRWTCGLRGGEAGRRAGLARLRRALRQPAALLAARPARRRRGRDAGAAAAARVAGGASGALALAGGELRLMPAPALAPAAGVVRRCRTAAARLSRGAAPCRAGLGRQLVIAVQRGRPAAGRLRHCGACALGWRTVPAPPSAAAAQPEEAVPGGGRAGLAARGPLVYGGGQLVFVPGLGIDARVWPHPGSRCSAALAAGQAAWVSPPQRGRLKCAVCVRSPRPRDPTIHFMALIVHKYGGTSMGSTERIRNVAKRVAKWARAGHQMVVVPSAMSGETNRLLGPGQGTVARPTSLRLRELDMIAATGEQVSVGLLALALQAEGMEAVSYAGWQVPIRTDSAYTKARIERIDDARVRADLAAGKVVVITGFQGVDEDGNITTLGRGGSDTSAVAVAAALEADECLIYTDVDGVYTTDPRIVPEARRLHTISFEEMLEMASLGSKVLQIRSVEFAGKYRVPLRVLSSFTPWDIAIEEEAALGHADHFRGRRKDGKSRRLGHRIQPRRSQGHRARRAGQARHRLPDPGRRGRRQHRRRRDRAERLARRAHRLLVHRAPQRLRARDGPAEGGDAAATGAAEITGDPKICKVSIVGIGMRSHVGVASKMFRTLAEEGINIQMISTSEIKTTVVIDEKYMELAVRALHKAFDLEQPPPA